MSKLIVVNSNNNVSVNNNVYTYNFVNGGVTIDQDETLAISQTSIPNSIANFSSIYNNLQFGYVSYGQSATFGTGSQPTFSLSAGSGYTRTVNITAGFLWIGYVCTISGFNFSSPLIITNMVLTDANSSTATITFNQYVYNATSTTGTAIIAGNQMVVSCSSGVPQPNMLILPNYLINSSVLISCQFFFNYIVSVVPQSNSLTNNVYLLNLYTPIPSYMNVIFYQTISYNTYINQVNLQNGYYSITDLNTALQQTMYQNGHFFYYEPIVNGASLTGEVPATILYPLTLGYNLPQYCFSLKNIASPDPTLIQSTFGTNGGLNQNYITNANFGDYPILPYNSSITVASGNSQSITSSVINGWTATTNNSTSNQRIYAGSGYNTYTFNTAGLNVIQDPASQSLSFTQYIGLSPDLTSDTCAITQTSGVYFPAGTYTCSFWVCKGTINGGGLIDTLKITLDTTYTINLQDQNVWVQYSQNFTSTGQTITLAFTTGTFYTAQNIFAISGIQFNNTKYPAVNNWKYGYSNSSNVAFFPSAFSTPTITQTGNNYIANYLNPYGLPKMLINATGGNLFTSFPAPVGNIPYGLGMNPVNGMIIKCNLTSNDVCNQTDNIDVIPLLSNFGSNNLYIGNPFSVIKLKKGRYSSITFTLCDQNGNQITLLDKNLTMSFILLKSGFKNFSK